MLFSFEHAENTPSAIRVMAFGRFMVVSSLQPLKALSFIYETLLGILMLTSPLPLNPYEAIPLSPLGSVMLFKLVQPLNIPKLIVSILFGSVTLAKLVQLSNSELP